MRQFDPILCALGISPWLLSKSSSRFMADIDIRNLHNWTFLTVVPHSVNLYLTPRLCTTNVTNVSHFFFNSIRANLFLHNFILSYKENKLFFLLRLRKCQLSVLNNFILVLMICIEPVIISLIRSRTQAGRLVVTWFFFSQLNWCFLVIYFRIFFYNLIYIPCLWVFLLNYHYYNSCRNHNIPTG